MLFYSTNRNSPEVGLVEALFTGQAPDKGLYMPGEIPALTREEITSLAKMEYPQIARLIMSKFVSDLIPDNILKDICEDAYGYEVPIEPVTGEKSIMRLDRGPTASFKDFAARMMARLFAYFIEQEEDSRELVILTATSGDTGSAIAHAFHNVDGIRVMVLFPPDEVSNRQRKQMTTLGGNIITVAVDGKFDDCQALVKSAFADSALKSIRLTSANSINIGRLLPQIVYYAYGYSRVSGGGDSVIFSIPSGNFGNMMGALLSMRMGLPLKKLLIATNANDEVPVFMKTGSYSKISPSRVCISNAMNVGHPSNFARVIDIYGGQMDETGLIHEQPDTRRMKEELWPVSIDDARTRETIRDAWNGYRILLEPHGAVGWAAAEQFTEDTAYRGPLVSVETAHPAKFPEEIQQLLGFSPEIPASLSGLETRQESYISLANDYGAFRALLVETYT